MHECKLPTLQDPRSHIDSASEQERTPQAQGRASGRSERHRSYLSQAQGEAAGMIRLPVHHRVLSRLNAREQSSVRMLGGVSGEAEQHAQIPYLYAKESDSIPVANAVRNAQRGSKA